MPPKKTDAIELRVSPEEKARLKSAASAQGLTVSALIRRRLADVLGAETETGRDMMTAIAQRTRQALFSRPGLAGMAGALSLGALALFAAAPSAADAVQMDISAQVAAGESVSSARRSLRLEHGDTVELEVPGAAGTYLFRISTSAVDETTAMVDAEITHALADGMTIVAQPRLMVAYGQPADIVIGAPDAPEVSVRIIVGRN